MAKRRSNGEGCVYKEGRSGRWVAKFQIGYYKNGQRKFKSCRAKTEREVRQELKDLMEKHSLGIDITNKSVTVGDFYEDWFNQHAIQNLRASTIQSYEMIIRRHIKPHIGSIKLAELTSNDIRQFYQDLCNDGRLDGKGGLSEKTVLNVHLLVSSGINHALKEGLIIRNPLLTVKVNRGTSKEISIFTRGEQERIIEECPNHYYGMAVKFDFYTGLREGELLGLTWDSVDFEKNTIRINKQVQRNKTFSQRSATKTVLGFVHNTKTKTSRRTIKVLPPLMKALEEYKAQQDIFRKKLGKDYCKNNLVFPREDGHFTDPATFAEKFKKIQTKLDIPHKTVHAIRHTFATRAIESGVHIKVVSETLGHASIQITMDIYGHVLQDFAEQELSKMEGIYR